MARILRGDIVWADLNPVRGREQSGQRPVVVISQNVFNERSGIVIAVALTSRPQNKEKGTVLIIKQLGVEGVLILVEN